MKVNTGNIIRASKVLPNLAVIHKDGIKDESLNHGFPAVEKNFWDSLNRQC